MLYQLSYLSGSKGKVIKKVRNVEVASHWGRLFACTPLQSCSSSPSMTRSATRRRPFVEDEDDDEDEHETIR